MYPGNRLLAIAVAIASCDRAPPWTPPRAPLPSTVERAVLFVREGAPSAEADGSRGRPFGTIAGALNAAPPGALVRVEEGTYEEALEIRSEAVLVGAGPGKTRIVGSSERRGPVLRIRSARVEIRALSIEGGEVGVAVTGGSLRLGGVALREQRQAAMTARDADVVFAGGEVLHVGDGNVGYGLQVEGGTLDLTESVLRAAGRRAVEVRRGKARLRDLDAADSAVSAVQAVDGADVIVEGGRYVAFGGAALYGGGARLTVRRARIASSEYGILGFRGAEVDVADTEIDDTRIAGIALVGSSGVVAGCAIARAGSDAAIAVTNPPDVVRLLNNRISEPGPMGVHVTQAEMVLEANKIFGARLDRDGDLGDAVFAMDSKVELARNILRGNAGSGITSIRSKLALDDNQVGGNGRAGLVLLDRSKASVHGNGFEQNGGPGVIVAERSRARLAANTFAGNRVVDVDQVCGGAGHVELRSGNRFLGPVAPRRRCP